MSDVERTIESLRPRALAHRGTVAAAGCWLDVRLIGEVEARRRSFRYYADSAAANSD